MTVAELVELLEAEGLDVTGRQIDYLVHKGRIGPPRKDRSGRRQFTRDQVDEIRLLLQLKVPQGRNRPFIDSIRMLARPYF